MLEIRSLSTHFHTREGTIKAVDNVSLRIDRGETLAVVGESGSGKSVLALSIMRLVPLPGLIVSGEILFGGQNLLYLDPEAIRRLRGRRIAMIFQDPLTSLNPVYTVGEQIAEAVRLHKALSRKQAWARAVEMMDRVRIPDPGNRASDYPHHLSGGMRQRVMIAMALSCDPELLIADEPTTALDVTIQAGILDLLARLKEEFDISLLLITHDLGVVAQTADRVAVMYAGRIVESGAVREIFHSPGHPYTEGLLLSAPRLTEAGIKQGRLRTIEGAVPNLLSLPQGCAFAPRCSHRRDDCSQGEIPLFQASPGHESRCILLS
jgi:oligopeptide/dipeptide ABC transporter ATP-binding protein